MKNEKKSAFTLSETLTAMTIIGVLAGIVLMTVFTDKSRQEKINKTISTTLSYNFDVMYEAILGTQCKKKYDLKTMKDMDGDNKTDAKDIRSYLISSYMGEPTEDCSGLKSPEDFRLNANASCVDLAPNGFAAIYYDNTCTTTVDAIEDTEHENRIVNNTCGYIAFSVKGSKGIKGEDFFIYPFTKIGFSKRTIPPGTN